jgi:hypothetical protein
MDIDAPLPGSVPDTSVRDTPKPLAPRPIVRAAVLGVSCILVGLHSAAAAETYYYPASCSGSYSKQGSQEADLTTVAGTPISCDGVVLTFPDNGHILIQVAEKGAGLTPLGFTGDGLDYGMNPKFVTLPLSRIYMPHLGKSARPQIFEGIHGNCFLGWELNIRDLSAVTCSATIDLGPQELIYFVNIRIKGAAVDAAPRNSRHNSDQHGVVKLKSAAAK